jgi:hypothetical protein
MATAPVVKKPAPDITPEAAAEMQRQMEEQKRAAAEEKAYNAADMMSGEKAPKKMAKGGKISSASNRADGIAQRGKTRGNYR